MPKSVEDAKKADHLQVLLLSEPKVGKTLAALLTAPKPVYVIVSDAGAPLKAAARILKRGDFVYDDVSSTHGPTLITQAEAAWKEAREGAKEGRYKTILWDTLTQFAMLLCAAELEASRTGKGEPNPMVAYPNYGRRLQNYVTRLLAIPAHVIVTAHVLELSKELPGQTTKEGVGIVPAIEGSVRGHIARHFQDVVCLEKTKEDGGIPPPHGDGKKRIFVTSKEGVFGPGSRSLPGFTTFEADFTKLWEAVRSGKAPATAKPPAASKPLPPKTSTSKPSTPIRK